MEVLPSDWSKLHHAYIISGLSMAQALRFFEDKLSFKFQANPDALYIESETLGIEEARSLSDWAIRKSFGERKVAIVSANSFTLEAQNALLKLFEEPTANTYFFILIPNVGSILPTLLSRVRTLEMEPAENAHAEKAKTFMKSSIEARFRIINPIIKNKDKEEVRNFISNLSRNIEGKDKNNLEAILKAEKYISGRAPSIKMILEYLAINMLV